MAHYHHSLGSFQGLRKMNYLLCFLFLNHLITALALSGNYFIGDVAINCGSTASSTALDGREWIGDSGSKDIYFLQPKGKSRSSTTIHKSFHADPVPYMTARISSAQFHYTFQVNPGQIFIRLHFFPALYRGFEKSCDFFSVKAGPFALLNNFSATFAADALGVKHIVKEYCINVEEDQSLTVVFSPSIIGISGKTHAFINGIEIISMPANLYYTGDGDLGAHIVGQKNRFYVDNKTALEMVVRLNIGGSSISPAEDSGLHRRWSADANYLMESEVYPVNYGTRMIKYPSMQIYIAPLEIYQTSWSTNPKKLAKKINNLTWKIPVDVGFGYLIRLHFCELEPRIMKSGQREFIIIIDNQLVETNADVIHWSGENGIPVHRDYMAMIKGDRGEGKSILSIAIQSKIELIDGLLNGLEIIKLSNTDNNLAGRSHEFYPQASSFQASQLLNLILVAIRRNGITTSLTIVIILINIVVYNLRRFWEANLQESHYSLTMEGSGFEDRHFPPTSTEQTCRCFSFAEIQSATRNFNDRFVIGKGGFGNVYKGLIDNGTRIVAIKRLTSNSKQGAQEFRMEIETLSKLRHVHLVSLIGYCDESAEMILVYEYMPRGTLADRLYVTGKSRVDYFPLTWEQRLRICIGSARGLDYLHTGTAPGVIHRDVKDSNILLDGNFVAKVSDFGIAKLEKSSPLNSCITTNVKGTFGYLDPHYFLTRELSKKSDVYAFGVIMLVVLCGRPAVDRTLSEDQQSILFWAQERIREGQVEQIVDMALREQISSDSLKTFVEIANKCLHKQPRERPTMAQVVASLEFALQQELQQNAPLMLQDVEAVGSLSNFESTGSLHSVLEEMTGVGETNNEAYLQTRKVVNISDSRTPRNSRWNMLWTMTKSKNKYVLPGRTFIHFSITEIKAATDNFSSDRVINNNRFSKTYEGFIKQMETRVSIEKFAFTEKCAVEEVRKFCSEIEMLSQLHHPNLNILLGYCYCSESSDMFLVYEYTSRISLADHLYGVGHRTGYISLNWEQRLRICIGAARGIDYLHTSTAPGVIHRDIKDSSILLDENLVAKVSDFRTKIDKSIKPSDQFITAVVEGNPHFRDPYYATLGRLSKKSDVYSFGVVLLVVLCGKPVIDFRVVGDRRDLKRWAQKRIREGEVYQIIDSTLRGKISSGSLNKYVEIAMKCLHIQPKGRPNMAEVVASLETALKQLLQKNSSFI